MACGYKPRKSASLWDTLWGVGENLACNILGQRLTGKFLTEAVEKESQEMAAKSVEAQVKQVVDKKLEEAETDIEEEEAEKEAEEREEAEEERREEEWREEEEEEEQAEEAEAAEAAEAGEAGEAGGLSLIPLIPPVLYAQTPDTHASTNADLPEQQIARAIERKEVQYETNQVDEEVNRAEHKWAKDAKNRADEARDARNLALVALFVIPTAFALVKYVSCCGVNVGSGFSSPLLAHEASQDSTGILPKWLIALLQ